jgi:anti-sigma factor RsiW
MSTRDWAAELSAYIDGELSADDTRALEARLSEDPALRALEQRLRRTVTLMARVPEPSPTPAFRRAVLAAVAVPTFGERLRAWLSPGRLVPVGLVATAAAVTLVLVSGREVTPGAPAPDEEQLLVAQNLDLLEEMDTVGLESPEDLDVVATLHELEVHP